MPSRAGQRERRAAVSLSLALLLLPLAPGLAGCGGGGGPAPEQRPPGGEVDPVASTAGPGEIVVLRPSGQALAGAAKAFAWSQVEGPAVELEDSASPQAHFVMPEVP